jgi:alkyldihydroxyacetonephosphate synthase
MRRWNGWGQADRTYPLPSEGLALLEAALGPAQALPDSPIEAALSGVPESRLRPHPRIRTDPEARLRHARGQSLPDWVALRSGRIERFPDGVAFPQTEDDVRSLLEHAERDDLILIPYGGGTSVVGHINPPPDDRPVLTVDLAGLNRLLELDEVSRLATFEAGVTGPELERQLASRGFTLGHFPQSFEFSTLGGWIATRSTGQQSLGYGRIEALFAAGRLESPGGRLDLPAFPASAAGPDLRQLVLGSEGRAGILTRAVVRVRPPPTSERFIAHFSRTWQEGIEAVREAVQSGTPASMLRLSDPTETATTLALAGRPTAARWLRRGLGVMGFGDECCLLIAASSADSGARLRLPGLPAVPAIGNHWRRSRFLTPYLRNTLWQHGFATDTLETALPWRGVIGCAEEILQALRAGLDSEGERVLAFAHLSHAYPDGASLYATFLFRRSADPDQTLERWRRLKAAATEALLAHGGTISHQHGVGVDHAAYLKQEKGAAGLSALAAALSSLDPQGRMNPGKLLLPSSPAPTTPRP